MEAAETWEAVTVQAGYAVGGGRDEQSPDTDTLILRLLVEAMNDLMGEGVAPQCPLAQETLL